jgi:hypothetical protein
MATLSLRLLGATMLFAALSWAADVTGTWSGPMEMKRNGETRPDTAHFVLTQSGTQIKGTVGPRPETQFAITKGSLEGSDVYIEAAHPDKDMRLVLRLKLDGDKLTGTLKAEGPEADDMSGTMTVSRAK